MNRFKVIILAFILSFLLFSCRVSQERCNELYPPQVTEVTTVKTDTVYKDSISIKYVKGDSILVQVLPRLPSTDKKIGKIRLKITPKDSGSVIECFADSLEKVTKYQLKEITSLKEILRKEQYKPPKKTFLDEIKSILAIALLLILFLFLIKKR